MTDLSQLLEKVRTATAGSRQLDLDICSALAPMGGPSYWSPSEGNRYTTSIDAIVALIRREFPATQINVHDFAVSAEASLGAREFAEPHQGRTPALALCATFLSAMLSAAQVKP